MIKTGKLMQALLEKFKGPRGVIYHGGAVIYATLMYALGVTGLFHANIFINLIATLMLAHGMTIAAYLIHECGHNIIFRTNEDNARLGRYLSWVCGASYGTYEDIRHKHFRHHVDNDDVVWFDYEKFFNEHPLVLKVTKFLEWFYIPAHDLIMHAIMVFTSFIIPERRDQRKRNVTVILIRGSIFLTILILFPKVALLYAVAYMIMMQILRFMDCLQHDYGPHMTLFSNETPPHKGDLEWEQEHTFSNPHTLKYDWPNWLTLNFGFHNAHHAKPVVPWYRLPALHRELFGENPELVIPLSSQLKIFHKYRVERVMGDDGKSGSGDQYSGKTYLKAAQDAVIPGGNAASFLTSF